MVIIFRKCTYKTCNTTQIIYCSLCFNTLINLRICANFPFSRKLRYHKTFENLPPRIRHECITQYAIFLQDIFATLYSRVTGIKFIIALRSRVRRILIPRWVITLTVLLKTAHTRLYKEFNTRFSSCKI